MPFRKKSQAQVISDCRYLNPCDLVVFGKFIPKQVISKLRT